jgi:CubicO group peptidase (beta-lactamase class C family)
VSPAFRYVQPEEVGLSSEKLNRLGDDIVSWIANGELVGAELLVIKSGRAVFHEAYGWGNREARRPMRRNSIFTIQSMSKPFTATAVLMLVEAGKLSLDASVSRYVPGFTHDSIRIQHLLSHTSGFIHDGDWYDYVSPDASLENLVETWPYPNPERPVGTYNYADFNFATLAYIVTKASGTPIDAFIEERIIRPLGLEDTRIGFSSDPTWRARLNSWYRWNDRTGEYDLRNTSDFPGWTIYPGGWGLLSTAMDYAEFMGMWMNRGEWRGVRLLAEETVDLALRHHAYSDGSAIYGYGWFVEDLPGEGRGSFYHGGGHGTLAIAFPADDAMVIYMTQSRWGPHSAAFWNRLYMSGLFTHPGIGPGFKNMVWADNADVAEIRLSPEQRARYVGTYSAEEPQENRFEVQRVWEEGGILHIRMGRSGSEADHRYHLVPLGEHRFALGRYQDGALRGVDPTHGVRFVVENGAASKLEFTEGDRVQFTSHREP